MVMIQGLIQLRESTKGVFVTVQTDLFKLPLQHPSLPFQFQDPYRKEYLL